MGKPEGLDVGYFVKNTMTIVQEEIFGPVLCITPYKKSGVGREWEQYGFEEYLETKSIIGYQ